MNYRFYEWKIISIFVLVFILVQGGSYVAISSNANRVAIQNTRQALETGSAVLSDLLALRASQLSLSTQALAADESFLAAIESNDQALIRTTLAQHMSRLGAAAIFVSDAQQQLIASEMDSSKVSIDRVTDLHPRILAPNLIEREIVPLDIAQETLFQVISAPLQLLYPPGRLSIAFSVGDPLWQDIGRTASTDFIFLLKNSDQTWEGHASTYPAVVTEALLDEYNQGTRRIEYYELGDYEFAFHETLLSSTDDTELYALVGKSIAQVMAPYVRLQKTIFGLTLVALVLSVLAVVLVTRRFVAPLNTLAHVDNLTGVANRRLLDLSLQTLCNQPESKSDTHFALLMADLNAFKHINDQYGHDAGDIVLQTIARRLLNGVRRSDLVARYGGDEFAVLLSGVNEDAVRQILVGLQESLKRPIRINENDLEVGVSIGIALYPQHGRSVGELQRRADVAMYAAKTLEDRHAFFESSMDAKMSTRRG